MAPADLVDEVADTKRLIDFGSPVLDQLALRRFLEVGDYDRHVRRTRRIYRARRDRLIAALAAHLPEMKITGVAAGLHGLMQLPPGVDDEHVAEEAAWEGMHVETLSRYNFDRRNSPGLVIGYGRIHEAAIEPAVSTLASVMSRIKGFG